MHDDLKRLYELVKFYGTDVEEKDLDLRNILLEILNLISRMLEE